MNYAELLAKDLLREKSISIIEEPEESYYSKNEYPFQEEAYKIIGACMEVHKVFCVNQLKISLRN